MSTKVIRNKNNIYILKQNCVEIYKLSDLYNHSNIKPSKTLNIMNVKMFIEYKHHYFYVTSDDSNILYIIDRNNGKKESSKSMGLKYQNKNILDIYIDNDKLAIVTDDKIYIFMLIYTPEEPLKLENHKKINIMESSSNLSVAKPTIVLKPSYFMVAVTEGSDIIVYKNETVTTLENAHSHPIKELKFNVSGALLTSISEHGTIVRVWAYEIPENLKLYREYRRGMWKSSDIYNLNYREDSEKILLINGNTLHVYNFSDESNTYISGGTSFQIPSTNLCFFHGDKIVVIDSPSSECAYIYDMGGTCIETVKFGETVGDSNKVSNNNAPERPSKE